MEYTYLVNRKLLLLIAFGIVLLGIIGGVVIFNKYTETQKLNSIRPIMPVASGKTYTLVDVSAHAEPASCWTAINGKVYDVTSFINQHPGGDQRILSLCGTDGSSAFDGQHSGEGEPESYLAAFEIGTFSK